MGSNNSCHVFLPETIFWKEVKILSGVRNSSPCSLLSHLDVDELESLPLSEVADYINHALLEPLEEYRLTEDIPKLPLEKDQLPEFLVVTEEDVYTRLSYLNPAKVGGPYGIPNWVLREYAEFLAYPISVILSASFKEQRLPSIWKLADVTPLPKQKPVREIKKDLWPISLTPCISKLAEDFVVTEDVKPAILCMLDPSQFGAIPKSSTTLALLEMLHEWTQGTDGNGATIRTLLFDYKKAFDLIDHSILVRKLCALSIPPSIINWIIDFLSCRSQRIKLTEGCVSEWSTVPSSVPQGTKLGPWLFLIMINDLAINNASIWKYVDDTTASEVIRKGQVSNAQTIADEVAEWSNRNRVKLNIDKCKELRILFASISCEFPPVAIGGEHIKVVSDAKLLGLTISSDLTWNAHITEVIKKAAKRLYFLIQLKRARVSQNDLCLFYVTCVRSIIDYPAPVFHYSLPAYLMQELECIQKRAMRIICPGIEYQYALVLVNLSTVAKHHNDICRRTFESICNDSGSKLKKLLPPLHECKYELRHTRTFNEPRCKTNRAKNSFIMASCSLANRF